MEVRGSQVRQLTPVGDLEKQGDHLEQEFKLDARVSDRTDSDTFAVCKAVQKVPGTLAGDENVFKGAQAQQQLNIFYPPQPQEKKIVGVDVDENAKITLLIEAYPSPRKEDIKWSLAESDSAKYKMEVIPQSSSDVVKLTLSVLKVEEGDYNKEHEVSVENEHGKEVYRFEVVEPAPAWVILLIILGCLVFVVAIVAIGVLAKNKSESG